MAQESKSKKTSSSSKSNTAKKKQTSSGSRTAKKTSAAGSRAKSSTASLRTSGKAKETPEKNLLLKRERLISTETLIEIAVVAVTLLCILFFISAFNLAGPVGSHLRAFEFGLFGLPAYLFPLLFFFSFIFIMANPEKHWVVKTAAGAAILYVALCFFIQLLAGTETTAAMTWKECYEVCSEGQGGGLLGCLFVKLLTPLFGTFATWLIDVILFVAGFFVTFRISPSKLIRNFAELWPQNIQDEIDEQKSDYADALKAKRAAKKKQHIAKKTADLRAQTREIERDTKNTKFNSRLTKVSGVTNNRDLRAADSASGAVSSVNPSDGRRQTASASGKAAGRKSVTSFSSNLRDESPELYHGRKIVHSEKEEEVIRAEEDRRTIDEIDSAVPKKRRSSRPAEQKKEDPFVVEEIDQDERAPEGFPDPSGLPHLKVPDLEEFQPETPRRRSEPVIHRNMPAAVPESETPEEQAEETPVPEFRPSGERKTESRRSEGRNSEDRSSGRRKPSVPVTIRTQKTVETAELEDETPEEAAMPGGDWRDDPSITVDENSDEDDPTLYKTVTTANGKVITVELDGIPGAKKIPDEPKKISDEEALIPNLPEEEPKEEYIFPDLSMLQRGERDRSGEDRDDELRQTAEKLRETLESFDVGVEVTEISCGPTVTRYELVPDHGVKVSRILSLQNDIKLSLAAADIRIEAPIPGKAAIGIEVPNRKNMLVALRDLLETKEFQEYNKGIAFAVGKDIAGRIVIADLCKMPHLLIAGATGSGKSVCINTLIMSILFHKTPEQVKLILIDPKVVELTSYNGIPHLLTPVVTDPKAAQTALNWAIAEMTRRYKMFAQCGVREIDAYNSYVDELEQDETSTEKLRKMPRIVIIIDELADLMMVSPKEMEDAICRLAQLARAAGIHLIIATQRPSVNVITGTIKANVPSRIAFAVTSGVDSKTIIDTVGAEKLLGNGDMLYHPQGKKAIRVQGSFVSDKEVSNIVAFLKDQKNVKGAEQQTAVTVSEEPAEEETEQHDDRDPLFEEAGRFLIEKDKGSIGVLQRQFRIGFNRAARIMDQLAEADVVGPEEGTKPRRILMTIDQFDEYMSL